MKETKWSLTNIFILAASILIVLLSIFVRDNNTVQAIIGAVIVLVLIIIDIQAPKIARLSKDNPKIKTLRTVNRIAISIGILITIYVKLNPLEGRIPKGTKDILLVAGVSLFMMLFGNIAPKIPFNRYVGLRLPWTVRDEDTWRLAHKLVGYTAFPLAIIQFVLVFFMKAESIVTVCILLWVAIPGIYSGWFFFKKFKKV
jgi:uncharacterized membrane protein